VIAEIQRRLPELGLPFLSVWGMCDRVFQPVFLDQWRELLPDARVVEIEDAAHFVVEDRPDALSEAIDDFLTSL
jgi:haloalkane dehalogenase